MRSAGDLSSSSCERAAEQVITNSLSACFPLCVTSVEYLLPGHNSWPGLHAVLSAGQSQIGLEMISSLLLLFLLKDEGVYEALSQREEADMQLMVAVSE